MENNNCTGIAKFQNTEKHANLQISNDFIIIFYHENNDQRIPLQIADINSGGIIELDQNFKLKNIKDDLFVIEIKNHPKISMLFEDLSYLENTNFKINIYSNKLDDVTNKLKYATDNQVYISDGRIIKIHKDLRKRINDQQDELFDMQIVLWNRLCTIIYDNAIVENKFILTEIECKSGKLSQLNRNVFQAFPSLRKIELSFSEIDALDENIFKNLGHLKEINFSFNSINRIESGLLNSDLVELTSIELHDNDIVKLPPDFSQHLKKLVKLNVSHNQISSLDANIFSSCESLEEVYFNSNSIRELNRCIFDKNKRLVKIEFDDNKISNLPHGIFMNCEKLSEISFARNSIEKLESSIFRGQLNLTKIDFSHNQISELSPGIFVGLKKLVDVNFANNYITRLHPEIFDDFLMKSFESIDFRCDYESINIFSTWDYQRVYNEFFRTVRRKVSESRTSLVDEFKEVIIMNEHVFTQYLIMISLSKQKITPTLLKNTDLESFFKNYITEANDNNFDIPKDYFDENKFTLLDFLLLCNGITSKMLLNILEKINKNGNHTFSFKVTKKESIDHLCELGNEKLIIEIDRYFEKKSFKDVFEKAFLSKNESGAIGFVKIFWDKIKKECEKRDFKDVVCKYEFYLSNELNRCFDAKWWLFFKELLEIHKNEMRNKNFEMAQFYLTLFEKNYDNTIQRNNPNDYTNCCATYINLNHLDDIENVSVDNHLLNLINKSEREDFIVDATTKHFLNEKWKGIPRFLYYIHLFFYIAFLILYMINLELVKKNNMRVQLTWSNVILILMSGFFLVEEGIQWYLFGKAYWKDSQNILELPTYLLCLFNLMIGLILYHIFSLDVKEFHIVLYAITIISGFGILILRLKNIEWKSIGVYVTIFENIIIKSFRVLPVILLSLIAFSFAFRVSAKSNEIVEIECKNNKTTCNIEKEDLIEFYNGIGEILVYNIVRLLTMSLGEYSTFQMGLFGKLDLTTIITNYIAYVLFILVLPILAINMFIGISVDEMRKLFEKSESQNIKNKIEYVLSIQKVRDNKLMSRFCFKPLMSLINTCCNQDRANNIIDIEKKTKKKSSDDILKKNLGIVKRIENRIDDIQNEIEVSFLKQKAGANEKFWKLDEQFSRFDARLTKLEESVKFAADVNKESLKKLNELEEWIKLNKRKNKN